MSFETSVGTSDADSITVMGRDLAGDLMGRVTLSELAFLVVRRRMPTPEETRLFDAVLVSLTDHGLTPTVLAARLTQTGAPESPQAAVAAGLLGAGSVFLGPTGDTATFLQRVVVSEQLGPGSPHDAVADAAARAVGAPRAEGRRVPGL